VVYAKGHMPEMQVHDLIDAPPTAPSAPIDAPTTITTGTSTNPFTDCTTSQCSLDGCDINTFTKAITTLKALVPQKAEPSLEATREGVKAFKKCMDDFMSCSETSTMSTDETQFCSSYPRCNPVSGFFCAHAAKCIGARALFCVGKHMAMNTGHSFDFFAAPGGFALPLSVGLQQNPSLKGVQGAPFYTSCEMNAEHYEYFDKNMLGKNYLLLKNEKCYDSSFDTTAFVKATAATLEIITQDPNGADVANFISGIMDYSVFTEEFPNMRYHLIQQHPEKSETYEMMERLVKEKKWTRVWYSRTWFKWSDIFQEHRPDTNFVVYAKGHMPEMQVHDLQTQW